MNWFSTSTADVPYQKLMSINTETKVKVITADGNGKKANGGGANVNSVLSCNKEECPVIDNGDGTYTVSVIPQQLGQHQLSITVNGQDVQDSPFNITIVPVPQMDYTKLVSAQVISGVKSPKFIAFSNNGDMFVTSDDHCVHVYDKSGVHKKATIGSKGTGNLQLIAPRGIDIHTNTVFVCESGGHRIHRFTLGGEFIDTFGKRGSDVGEFEEPYDIKINPNNSKVYIADRNNHRVQVFNFDWSIAHIINGRVSGDVPLSSPEGIAIDPSGNVHVTWHESSSVTIFSPTGEFIYSYGVAFPIGIAIDPSGYSFVASWSDDIVSIFDLSGKLVCPLRGFSQPFGVSVSPDGRSIWVADSFNDQLVKF